MSRGSGGQHEVRTPGEMEVQPEGLDPAHEFRRRGSGGQHEVRTPGEMEVQPEGLDPAHEFKKKGVGVIVFPGSNCEQDVVHAVRYLGGDARYVWHHETDVSGFDVLVLPGGFAYGDYLRTGAIAAFSPVMDAVRNFASDGGLVIGICNGFQILCEAGLLPGALLRNTGLKFRCVPVHLRIETTDSPFTLQGLKGDVLEIPINHFEGNYYCDLRTLSQLEEKNRIAFRYCSPSGEIDSSSNPNGALSNIAGVLSERKNVLGMMPHPERATDPDVGGIDGQVILRSLLTSAGVLEPVG
jgi:phosphoribosylformylglycinamidine synthase I